MNSAVRWIVALVLVAAAAGGGYWLGRRSGGGSHAEAEETDSSAAKVQPIATVRTVPIRRSHITSEVMAYGSVVAQPGEMRIVSVPYEIRVRHMFATPGQPVEKGAPLVEVEASPDTQLALRTAQNDVEAATTNLKQIQERFNDHLATNQELYQARQALQAAQLKLESLTARGVGPATKLAAQNTGVVGKVDVQEGQIVTAGGPLVEVITANRIEVRLGIEPEGVGYLQRGQPVQLMTVGSPSASAVNGKVRLVGQRVDPTARLVDVFVTLPQDSKLLLEDFVAAKLSRVSAEGLLVPRDALVSDGAGGFTLFAVKDSKAVKHSVKVGLENDREVQVIADDLHEGELVVVLGSYELEDGMKVQAQPAEVTPEASEQATTAPAATEPATTGPTTAESASVPEPATQPAATEPAAAPPSPPNDSAASRPSTSASQPGGSR